MMAYHMGWVDNPAMSSAPRWMERSHGVLCLLAAQAFGGDADSAVPAAAAVELVHNFTLIHDDVQGGQPQRANRDAVWWVWGPAQAINAGDGMHALARLALLGLQERGVSPETTFAAVQVMDECSLLACEGRFMDLEAQERIDVMVNAYLKMAEAKTGSLLAMALRMGALVGTGNQDAQQAMNDCGNSLGVAMQIRADLRELWPAGGAGDSSTGNEVLNKKKLLPVVYALEHAEVSQKRRIGEVYFKRVLDAEDAAKLRDILEDMGVREKCEAIAGEYRARSLDALAGCSLPAGRDSLAEYIDNLLE
jgi:geranylgeranyl diphosphate synthase type I